MGQPPQLEETVRFSAIILSHHFLTERTYPVLIIYHRHRAHTSLHTLNLLSLLLERSGTPQGCGMRWLIASLSPHQSASQLNKHSFLSIRWALSDNSYTPIPHNNQVARPEDARERANKSQLSSEVYSYNFAVPLPSRQQITGRWDIFGYNRCVRMSMTSGMFPWPNG